MTTSKANQQPAKHFLSCVEILQIANQDAQRVYDDLSNYRITLILEQDGWHVDYDLTQPYVAGGGPHYVIDPVTGDVISRKYEQ